MGREAGLLLSDEREYNIRFRGKVLLDLPASPQSLAFSRIFTSHFLKEATFFGVLISYVRCKSAPAKELFMPTGVKVHSSLTTFLLIAPLAILISQPHHFALTLVSVRVHLEHPGGSEMCLRGRWSRSQTPNIHVGNII